MVALIVGMLICVGLALAVVALVAIPARRDGRDILTPKGDEVVTALKERQQSARQRLARGDDDGDATGDDGDDKGTLVDGTDASVQEDTHADAGARS
jgi:hypothetical protein